MVLPPTAPQIFITQKELERSLEIVNFWFDNSGFSTHEELQDSANANRNVHSNNKTSHANMEHSFAISMNQEAQPLPDRVSEV